jgi:hypothetical protein
MQDLNIIQLTARQRLKEWRNLGMSNQSITNLINGLMLNKINNNNMLFCLEVKNLLNNNKKK